MVNNNNISIYICFTTWLYIYIYISYKKITQKRKTLESIRYYFYINSLLLLFLQKNRRLVIGAEKIKKKDWMTRCLDKVRMSIYMSLCSSSICQICT